MYHYSLRPVFLMQIWFALQGALTAKRVEAWGGLNRSIESRNKYGWIEKISQLESEQ